MSYDFLKLMYHLDNLREKMGVSKKDICKDVCEVRQFYKYLDGTNKISDKRLTQFLDNLNIEYRDFYYTFYEKDKYEHKFVKNLYYDLINKRYPLANEKTNTGKKKNNLSNNRLFMYCESRYSYETKIITKRDYHNKLSKIADYPKCIQKSVFDFSDIVSIHSIVQLEVKEGKEDALSLLQRILSDSDLIYLSSTNKNILPTIYSSISILLGRLKKYEDRIKIAESGVSYCRKHSLNKSLSWLFYALAIAYKEGKNEEKAELYSSLCVLNTAVRGDEKERNSFYTLLLDDFNLSSFEVYVNNKEIYMQGELIQ